MNQAYMPKSKSDIHITPDRVFYIIQDEWDFLKQDMFDPCPVNPCFDGLNVDWEKINFVNPPYTLLKEFVEKAIEESYKSKKTIMLLPSKTDQQWFHDLIDFPYKIVWIRKRLKFKNNKHSSMQPHFLVMIDENS